MALKKIFFNLEQNRLSKVPIQDCTGNGTEPRWQFSQYRDHCWSEIKGPGGAGERAGQNLGCLEARLPAVSWANRAAHLLISLCSAGRF